MVSTRTVLILTFIGMLNTHAPTCMSPSDQQCIVCVSKCKQLSEAIIQVYSITLCLLMRYASVCMCVCFFFIQCIKHISMGLSVFIFDCYTALTLGCCMCRWMCCVVCMWLITYVGLVNSPWTHVMQFIALGFA